MRTAYCSLLPGAFCFLPTFCFPPTAAYDKRACVRTELIEELDAGDATLEIPWASSTEPRLRYIDLKTFPEEIDRLEECRRHPSLAALLRAIHSPGSLFRTAKCDVWTTTRLSEDERIDFKLPFKAGGYVDLLFDRVRLNSRLEPQLRLGRMLEQAARPWRRQAQMEIAVRRCLFHPRERWGYYLTIFIHAYGSSRGEAKREWDRATQSLGEALSAASDCYLRESGKWGVASGKRCG